MLLKESKPYYLGLGCLLAATWLLPATAAAGEKVNEQREAPLLSKISIENVRGEVTIRGWDQPRIQIKGELDDEAEGLVFDVKKRYAKIKVEMPSKLSHGDGSELEIFVPQSSMVKLKGVDTEFTLENLQAGFIAQTVSGDINSVNSGHEIHLKSVSGDVRLKQVQGKAKVETVSGGLTLDGEMMLAKLKTINGDIRVEVDDIERLQIHTVAGDARVSGTVMPGGEISVDSVNGDLTFQLNEDLDAQCELTSQFGGAIRNKFTEDQVVQKGMTKQWLEFVAGDGSGQIQARTINGTITLATME